MQKKIQPDQLIERRLKGLTSNTTIIKHIVYNLGPISAKDIAQIISKVLLSFKPDEDGIKNNILPILKSNNYYREVNDKWEVVVEEFPEHKVLPELFAREHSILTEREVRNKIADALSIRTKEVCIDLERDANVKRFNGGWGLKKWKLVNDEAVEILKQHESPLSKKEILQLIAEKYKKPLENIVISPEFDSRFVQERKAWTLKEYVQSRKSKAYEKELKIRRDDVHLELEDSFLKAQGLIKKEPEKELTPGTKMKVKLRKPPREQIELALKERELHVKPIEADLAAELSSAQTATSAAEVTSYNRVEHSLKERSLSPKEREAIISFVSQLLELEDKAVVQNLNRLKREPLSLHKILNLLRLKYVPYFTERVVIGEDYYKFAAELITPIPGQTVINPSAYDALFAVEVLSAVYERLEGAAWAPHGNEIEIVQKDGIRSRINIENTSLLKKAQEDFLITQTDILDYFVENNFVCIEYDKLIAQCAKYVLRLAGFPNVYLANRDFLSELAEVFGETPNEQNEISLKFDLVFGNFTFLKSHNLSANYIDQSLRILEERGVCAFFVLKEVMKLLKDHPMFEEMRMKHFFRYVFNFPQVENVNDVLLVVLRKKAPNEDLNVPLITANVKDVKDLRYILVDLAREIKQSSYYESLSQDSVRRVLLD